MTQKWYYLLLHHTTGEVIHDSREERATSKGFDKPIDASADAELVAQLKFNSNCPCVSILPVMDVVNVSMDNVDFVALEGKYIDEHPTDIH